MKILGISLVVLATASFIFTLLYSTDPFFSSILGAINGITLFGGIMSIIDDDYR